MKTNKTMAPKSFTRTVDGSVISYRRTEKGYCYMGSDRISQDAFEQAEIDMLRERQEREAKVLGRISEQRIDGTDLMFVVDGTEYRKSPSKNKYYMNGMEIDKARFDRNVHGKKSTGTSRKPRRSKDVAFEHEGVTLTAKQADFLRELSAAGRDEVLGDANTGWWCDCITDGIGGQFAGNPMSVGAMISTLCEKGLGTRSKDSRETPSGRTRKVTAFNLTDKGTMVWDAMGLDR